MNKKTLPTKKQWILHFFNSLLIIINLWSAFVLSVMLIADNFLLGKTFDYPSTAATLFVRKEFIVIPVLLTAFMIFKEFKIQLLKKRVYLNLIILAGLTVHGIFIQLLRFWI